MLRRLTILGLIILLFSCSQVEPPAPVLPLPTERQLAWHELEYYAFVHFNMNTFTNMEWGLGSEDPKLFNPSGLDCRQWARVAKEAGMKGIILTAKHHDGFCLWPTATTGHSVKNSPWKDGEGDVVQELADACGEYDLKLGIYLSPWDRNNAEYGNQKYIEIFRAQLKELMTNYGDVFEVWFDGANGGTGYYGGANEERRIDRKTYYDWENTRKIVRELQPMACMFSDAGPDIRWVGNEEGWAMKTNWAPIRRDEFYPGSPNYAELRTGHEDGTHWVPAEVDVSIRPGWYYHASEDHKVKTLPHLLDIYYNSIGRNASLLINFPVDTRGLIHENDAEQILKLAAAVKADFANNLAKDKNAEATNTRGNSKNYKAENIVDGNPDTYWATDDSVVSASVIIDLGEPTEINRFLAQEYIPLGQRVKKFSIDAWVNNDWKEIASETTIGRKRILRLDNVTTSKVRLNILDAKACPLISNIELYKAPKVLVEPELRRDKEGIVSISAFDSGLDIYYTLDGSQPDNTSAKYDKPFLLNEKATIKAVAIDPETTNTSEVSSVDFDIVKNKWSLLGTLTNDENSAKILDGDENTAWNVSGEKPFDVLIDLGEKVTVSGFKYLPDQGRWNPGIIFNYEFYVSNDGKNWGKAKSAGEFSNIRNSPVWQTKTFDPVEGRYIKLRAISPAEENGRMGIAEFDIITK
ncbi:discoidin domain-containing protein [Maribellus sediminis]|uniref:discoidin domain-containing protein n=1 Tax=Maribellus sediminis TaxID=2696285 RepID=UPI00142FEBFD|nr:discoidin domain-containing protein [Maribellus sediminis]